MESIWAFVEAELSAAATGLPSRLLDPLRGKALLHRVVSGILQLELLQGVLVACRTTDRARVEEALRGLPARIVACDTPDVPQRDALRRARKWALSSWRGGIGNSMVFLEEGNPHWMLAAAEAVGAEALMKFPSHSPLVEAGIVEQVLQTYRKRQQRPRLALLVAPPGYACEVYEKALLRTLALENETVQPLLRLDLEQPARDPVQQDFFAPIDSALAGFAHRLCADTRRGWERLEALMQLAGEAVLSLPAAQVFEKLQQELEIDLEPFPREVEVEITGEGRGAGGADAIPETGRSGARLGLDQFRRIAEQCAVYDDVCLTFGGYGEPTLHPELKEMIRAAREAGVYGLHLHTDGLGLEGETAAWLAESELEVISVELGADTRETYRRLKGVDEFDRVRENITRFSRRLEKADRRTPSVVVELVKVREVEAEIEEFCRRWYQELGWVVIREFNDLGGAREDRASIRLLPGRRGLCRKLAARMTVTCEGSVPVCAQDFRAAHPVGNLLDGSTIETCWQSGAMSKLRRAHREGRFDTFPFCSACKVWGTL